MDSSNTLRARLHPNDNQPSTPLSPLSPLASPTTPSRTTLFQLRKPRESRYGPAIELVRLLLFLTFFLSCTLIIHASQWIGAPLYFINKDYFYAWMAFSKQQYAIFLTMLTQWFAPTPIIVSGDASVAGQYWKTTDGRLETSFPERVLVMSNHQLYTDWVYLWWAAYTTNMHGHIFIVLKDTFKYVPIVGAGMMFFGFIFMSRKWATDQSRMAYHLKKLVAKHKGPLSGSPGLDPMWFLMYPEGTNLSANTRKKSAAWAAKAGLEDLKNLILPRSTGLYFALTELKDTIDYVYDITVGYGGIPPGEYGQDIFGLRSTYIAGQPPTSVNLYIRRFAVSDILLTDSKAFESWLLRVWREKDDLLEHWKTHGRFPAGPASSGAGSKSQGWVETEVKLAHWTDSFKIVSVLATVGLLANIFARLWNFVFYGKLCFNCV